MSTIQLPGSPRLSNQGLILAYLAIPNLFFLLGYVRPAIGIPLAALCLLALWRLFHESPRIPSATGWLHALIPAVLILLLAGLPYGGNTFDWIKHWAIINLLTDSAWPASAQLDGTQQWLRYYIAAYLPPALASKHVSILPPPITLTLWLGIGLLLIFRTIVGFGADARKGMHIAFGVLLASGLDYFAWPRLEAQTTEWSTYFLLRIPLQIPSTLTQLVWAPNQAIASLLVALLIAFDREPGYKLRVASAMCLAFLWSPFGVLGLVPLALWSIFRGLNRTYVATLAAWGSPFLVVSLVAYLYMADATSAAPYDLAAAPRRLAAAHKYALALLIELLPVCILLGRQIFTAPPLLCLCTIAAMALVTGPGVDLVMRGSAGPVFILATMAMMRLTGTRSNMSISKIPALLAIGAMLATTGNEILYLTTKNLAPREVCAFNFPIYKRSYTPEQLFYQCDRTLAPQYFTPEKPWILR